MNDRLEGKVAFITGAGSGIGRAAALLFGLNGASVTVSEINRATGEDTAHEIARAGGTAQFVETDVTDPGSVEGALVATVNRYGKLDILYNNAGGSTLRDGPAPDVPLEEFWRVMKLDLFGTWLVCSKGIPLLVEAGGGSVINTTSVVALVGYPGRDAYTAAKGAVLSLTRSLAVEFAPKRVRVNGLAPGTTRTPRVIRQLETDPISGAIASKQQLLGLGEPIDVAKAALYLASDDSRMVTGHIIPVDSGLVMARAPS